MNGTIRTWLIVTYTCFLAMALGQRVGRRVPHDEQMLYKRLLTEYISTVKPVVNASRSLDILFSIRLNQIVQLDERQQVLTTNVFIDQTWTDPALAWDPEEFRDVRSLTIPEDQVWRPDTFMYNNADNGSTGFISGTYIQIRHNGDVTWPASIRLRSSCVVKITYFPFDYQSCVLKFGSWIYSHPDVNYQVRPDTVSVDMSTYINNSQWELLDMKLDRTLGNHTRDRRRHAHLVVILSLKRNTFYYLFNIIVPCAMLSLLTLMTFWLPPTSGEKVTLGLSVFLAFSMFMLLIAEEVPASSDAVPLIGIYLCSVMTMTVISVIFAVVVTNLHNRGNKLKRAPKWVRTFCIDILAYMFGVSRDVQLLASTISLTHEIKYFILQDYWAKRKARYSQSMTGSDISEDDSYRNHRSNSHSQDHRIIDPLHSDYSLQSTHRAHHDDKDSDHFPKSSSTDPCGCDKHDDNDRQTQSNSTSEDETFTHESHNHSDYQKDDASHSHHSEEASGKTNTKENRSNSKMHSYRANLVEPVASAPLISSHSTCDSACLEDVWVLRDDVKLSSEGQGQSLTYDKKKVCRSNPSCKEACNREIAIGNELHRESFQDTPVKPRQNHRASETPTLRKVHITPRPSKNSVIFFHHNPKLEARIFKQARKMMAEWCVISTAVDRVLFTITLLLTLFAYIFILVFIPAKYTAKHEISADSL